MSTAKWRPQRSSHLEQPHPFHSHSLATAAAASRSTNALLQSHQPFHFTRHHTSSSFTSKLRPFTNRPLLVVLTLVLLLATSSSAQQSCTDSAGCFPPIGNLAIARTIVTNSSCMEGELLCPLFLLTPCQLCAANSSQNLNDGNNGTFWASQIGPEVKEVGLRLDFERPVHFQDMTMVWMSVRPIAMTLERSCDYGETWSVYRYYALNCPFYFNVPDTHISSATPPFTSTAPICTSVQSELFSFSFSDALVTFSTSEHIPANSQESACYHTITNLRVVLLDFFPELRLSNSSFQYYGVREWIVRGSCACSGHSGTCVPAAGEETATGKVSTGCECEHNTEGPSCGSCRDGFNNVPYQPGTAGNANACEACMCNNHAPDCVYNDILTSAVCTNCTDNTVGAECQDCAPGFFPDMGLLLDDPSVCRDCTCNLAGITDDGECNSNGQCSCKRNVGGLKCSECQAGFFNFSSSNPGGCQECVCDSLGTEISSQGLPVCDAITGQCQCRLTTEGATCDQCRPETYDFSSGCQSCSCNLGGSRGQTCDVTAGQCPCKPNIEGRDCSTPAQGFYALPLDHITLEAEDITGSDVIVPEGEELGTFTGSGFALVNRNTNITFTFIPPLDSQYQLLLRISTMIPAPTMATITLTTSVPDSTSTPVPESAVDGPLPPPSTTPLLDRTYTVAITPDMNQTYIIIDSLQLSTTTYDLTVASTGQLLVDSLVVMPDVSVTSIFYALANASQQERIRSCLPLAPPTSDNPDCDSILFTLSTEFYGDNPLASCGCSIDGSISQACTSAGCSCKAGVTGFTCDQCALGFFNLSSNGCEACLCNETGSISPGCTNEGLCSCLLGIDGPFCDNCAPDFFNFSSEGCTPCSCSQYSISPPSCDVSSGQCPCPSGATGRTCDSCLPGFFGLTNDGCSACNCDLVGSLTGICDPISGQCTCVNGLGGRACEICSSGFFYTGEVGGAETCKKCVCSGRGGICSRSTQNGRLLAVQYNFTDLCSTDSVNCGRGWVIMTDAGEEPSDPTALTVGFGYLLNGNDNPLVYVNDDFLGDRRHAYGQNFTVVLVIQSTAPLKNQNLMVRLGSSRSSRKLFAEPSYTIVNNLGQDERVLTLIVLLDEQIFSYVGNPLEKPTLLQFLDFLTGLTEISFTADYTVDFIELNYLRLVSLPFVSSQLSDTNANSSSTVVLSSAYPLENCSCDDPYQGLSCELCARGYHRPSGSIADECMQCQCNNNTLDCDSGTGVCLNCSGNTIGDSCERCMEGFYGDPTRGIPCLPCNCPVVGNGFSPTCYLNITDGLSTCNACAVGYTGRNCEICMDGFFGNPMIGRCITCECNGNVDPALGPVCDMTTGRCLNCLNNTVGFECQICRNSYFGDPGNDIACQPCPCDPRGTDSYCDSLFGTCFCLPNVISGGLCNECEDGYFNITEEVGCSPCNCATIGSRSSICNKASGDCDCYANVGSSEDSKCTACTPAFYNLSAGVGCEACGCSALAVLPSCDQLTGTCDCLEGAIGDKCDDCAFGFTGKVPNCEACHECYFQWYNLTSSFSSRVKTTNSSIMSLASFLYGDHTLTTITMEVSNVLSQLQMANMTLESITFDETSVTNITSILNQLNMTVGMFYERTEIIRVDLNEAVRLLNISNAFDGTLNMTDVIALEMRLNQLNNTIFSLSLDANNSITQLRADQILALEAWNTLNRLNMTSQDLLENLQEEEMNASLVLGFVDRLNRTFRVLRRNLTRLDMLSNRIERMIVRIVDRADNASLRLDNINMTIVNAYSELERRERELQQLLYLIRDYNSTVGSLEEAAVKTWESVQELQENVEISLNGSNALLQHLSHAHNVISNISRNFSDAVNIADRINSIVIPSDDYITDLAARITNNIIPDELVEGIMDNASLSRIIAWDALSLAQNASNAVMAAINLASSLQDEITCTTVSQDHVNATIDEIQERVVAIKSDISQVDALVNQLDNISITVNTTYYDTIQTIDTTEALGMRIKMKAENLSTQANASASLAASYYDDFLESNRSLISAELLNDQVEVHANATLAEAEELLRQARYLEATATRITPQEIRSLAQEFHNEIQRNDRLQQQITNLTQEMAALTNTFQAVSDRLRQCYRTP